ncbi:Uncharacterized protein K02A2.6 [Eumeta japonica]|uniref:RNA-directed DNA polymerase n=1 Tax=Eumeta variegata TaxID=151549 RepID=A0A4C1TKZ1_EUMVA|nr:Uncharacterized protein K02A2.6 [Eumeta japonica]
MCRKKGDARASHYLAAELAGDVEGNKNVIILNVNGSPLFVVVTLNRLSIECEVDSGSAVSAMSNTFYTAYFKHQALSRINGSLRCYDGSPITPRGSCSLSVTYRGRTKQIKFYIIDNGCHVQPAPILGRDFMSEFNLGISEMKYIDNPVIEETSVAKILMNKFPAVFSNKLGKLNKFKVQLQLKPDAKPIFFKPRPVPFALKPKVDEALDKLIETGILKSVNYSDYATPITPVLKSDGTVRVCGDYSVTLNKVLHIDRYPLPRIEELFARLHEGKEFSKLDLSMAYMQLELTEDSQPLTCINTHRGLSNLRLVLGYRRRLRYFKNNGTNSGRHRRNMYILDDILISGPNKDTHRKRLNEVLNRLQEAGLTLQKEKCVFFQKSIEYLGFVIDKDGLHTSPGKVKAIKEAEPPKNVSQLKSFLGLVNYYRSFVPRMSTILGPLHDLLKMGAKWMWSEAHQSAFETVLVARIDADIESAVGACGACTALRPPGPRATRALAVPARPWERVHLDMLSVAGGTHLVVVDAHSKWVEWAPLADGAGTEPVLRRLSEMLGRFGLPRTIVTDNATPFTSARFRRYCEVNDIKHVTIPPYHPASNGQAEITVKLIKNVNVGNE